MGQKIHPYGFRLGIQKEHHSNWFALKENYAKHVLEDRYMRQFFYKNFQNAGILEIHIDRQLNNHIHISIICIKSNYFLNSQNQSLQQIQDYLKNCIRTQKFIGKQIALPNMGCLEPIHLSIQVMECMNCDQKACFLADFLIDQLEKRIAFRRALKKTFKRTEKSHIQGLKIQISGRLNGAEIARTEWVRKGRVPLQTLRANIDYVHKNAKTIYGILGIKIWVFIDNEYT